MKKTIYEPGAGIPDSLGAVADMLAKVREVRLAMDKEVAVVRSRESELREHLINSLDKGDDTGVAGKTHKAMLKVTTKPKVNDWDAFYDYIVENDRFDMLQKRVSDKAVMDTLAEDGAVDGIEKIHIPEISLTKR